MSIRRLIFFVGPTGVGKSSHAHALAIKHQASILNGDSVQMYQQVNIGAAKPTVKERQEVPYHLLDMITPPDEWTAGDFHRHAMKVLDEELKYRHVFAVGGSGFYIRALEKGLYDFPPIPPDFDFQIKELLDKRSDQQLYDELMAIDSDAARKLHVNDRYRVERALVIWHGLNKKPSQVQKEFTAQALPYESLKIGLWIEKEELQKILLERIEQMNSQGFRQEVESLLQKGLENWWPLQSVGYHEWMEVLQGREKVEDVVQKILASHRRLAKKQMTWFKKDPSILWMHTRKDRQKLTEVVAQFLETGVTPCKV